MYKIEIQKNECSIQVLIDNIKWESIDISNKKTIIQHAVYNLDTEWNIPPELIDPVIEQGFKDESFGIILLTSAGKAFDKLHNENIKSFNFII